MPTTSAASARTGVKYFISGVQTARRAAGFSGLEHLYDRHSAAFGYPADQLKHATIGGLRDRMSWQSSLDALMRAVEIDPEEIEWQRWLALVFEELGRIDDALRVRRTITSLDRDSLENNFAIRRLLERKGAPVRGNYARVLTGSGNYLLALARVGTLYAPTVSEFLMLAEQPRPKEGCDPSSLIFAQAFVLDHSAMAASRFILSVDPIRFALARAALLLSHGAIVPALSEYLTAVSSLLVQKLPHTYQIYNGYKIVFFKNQLYGVPQNVRDFSILRGRVIDVPYADEGLGLRVVRSRFGAMLSDRQRARLKYLWRIERPHIHSTVEALRVALRVAWRVPVRAMRLALRMVRRQAGDIYLRMHTVSGVLIDNDPAQLQQRIDAPKQVPPDVTGSASTSV